MATFTAGTSFTDGVTGDVTAAKLNALVANATPLSNFITDRTAETSIATDDLVLISDTSDSGALNKMTVANLMKAELTGTINSTAGTIATLNSTTGVIPTLTSTTLITSGTGTAAAPAIVPTGDTNTGAFFPAADTVAISTAGSERVRVDSSGNVGVGVSPSNWLAQIDAIQISSSGAVWGYNNSNRGVFISDNVFRDTDGNYKYINSAPSTLYEQVGNIHAWYNAPSGTAGNNITFTERLRIDSSGNVGIGTTSPQYQLSIHKSGTTGIEVKDTTNSVETHLLSFSTGGILRTYTNHPLIFRTNDEERLRIDSSGNVGIGSSDPSNDLSNTISGTALGLVVKNTRPNLLLMDTSNSAYNSYIGQSEDQMFIANLANGDMRIFTNATERLRITSDGNFLVGKTQASSSVVGAWINTNGRGLFTSDADAPLYANRLTNDGTLVEFQQASTLEGTISVSGTTVSYNGGHLSRFSQLPSGQRDPSIKKGTVLSNLDEMCVWNDAEGNPLPNEQLNKVKISDVEGDGNVAGVFVNWDDDDQDNPFDLNMAMTGDMIIRIAQGVSVNRGDLLMSAGDGTAKPQGDDVVKSKTIAKVTSTNVTCTYEDGSYCVPCVLMAC